MEDKDKKLERELKELKAEVRRLRLMIECLCVAAAVLAAIMFPQIAVLLLIVTAVILLALLISPARRSVFPYLFDKQD